MYVYMGFQFHIPPFQLCEVHKGAWPQLGKNQVLANPSHCPVLVQMKAKKIQSTITVNSIFLPSSLSPFLFRSFPSPLPFFLLLCLTYYSSLPIFNIFNHHLPSPFPIFYFPSLFTVFLLLPFHIPIPFPFSFYHTLLSAPYFFTLPNPVTHFLPLGEVNILPYVPIIPIHTFVSCTQQNIRSNNDYFQYHHTTIIITQMCRLYFCKVCISIKEICF
jgi:hypothetical protein